MAKDNKTATASTSPAELIVAGRYRLLCEIDRGGIGVVYLVEHVNTGRDDLALKLLLQHSGANERTIERFKLEALAPARIKSDHVVEVTDAGVAPELGGAPFMVMEALHGQDLEKLVRQRGALAPHEVIWTLAQLATVIDKAHALNIVHRDLKPANIFVHVNEDGSQIVKLLDFGISKNLGPPSRAGGTDLTAPDHVLGTPQYMSPEQALNSSTVGPATDVWSMGVIAVRLLTGGSYWPPGSLTELLMNIANAPMPAVSERFPRLGNRIDEWFRRSCNRDPQARWITVKEQVRALAAALEVQTPVVRPNGVVIEGVVPPKWQREGVMVDLASSSPVTVTASLPGVGERDLAPGGTLPIPRRRPLRRRWFLALAVVLVVGLGAVATMILWRSSRRPTPERQRPAVEEPPPRVPPTPPPPPPPEKPSSPVAPRTKETAAEATETSRKSGKLKATHSSAGSAAGRKTVNKSGAAQASPTDYHPNSPDFHPNTP